MAVAGWCHGSSRVVSWQMQGGAMADARWCHGSACTRRLHEAVPVQAGRSGGCHGGRHMIIQMLLLLMAL